MRDEELEEVVRSILTVFRYVEAKDIFEAFYVRGLAKRLLLKKSASNEAEQFMIAQLKNECGSLFTQKAEGMFKDLGISETLNEEFHKKFGKQVEQETGTIDVSFHVLTQGLWPVQVAV